MSKLLVDRTDKIKLIDNIQVLMLALNTFNAEDSEQWYEPWTNYEKPTEQECTLYLPELYAQADLVGENETNRPDLREFTEAQSVNRNFPQALTTVEKPNSTLIYDTNRA